MNGYFKNFNVTTLSYLFKATKGSLIVLKCSFDYNAEIQKSVIFNSPSLCTFSYALKVYEVPNCFAFVKVTESSLLHNYININISTFFS